MGNSKSTIKLKLGITEPKLTDDHYVVTITKEDYDKGENLEQFTYAIEYKSDPHDYDLVIETDNGKSLFTYYNPSKKHRAEKVYVFYYSIHKSRPLIIGFNSNKDRYHYYRYHDLEQIKTTKTIFVSNIILITTSDLKSKLKKEIEIITEENKPPDSYKKGNVCIYFSNKGEEETSKMYGVNVGDSVKCSIRVTNKKYNNYNNIRQVTYTLVYSGDSKYGIWDNNLFKWSNYYYYLYFYTGTVDVPGRHIFTYYPRDYKYIVKEIVAYCSLLYINQPFSIVFNTEDAGNHTSTFDILYSRRTGYNYNLYFRYESDIPEWLKAAYKEKFNKFTFNSGNGSNENIKTRHYVFNRNDKADNAKKYKKYILISDDGSKASTLFSNCLFTLNRSDSLPSCNGKNTVQLPQEEKLTNKPIDTQMFKSISGQTHVGVLICYTDTDEIAVFVEIHTDWNTKHQFVRKNPDGDTWESAKHEYDSDSSLAKILESIESDMKSTITYRLEKNSNYTGNYVKVTSNKEESHGYTVHTHLPTMPGPLKFSKVLYKDKPIKIIPNTNITNPKEKLDKLEDHVFNEISLYSIDTDKEVLIMNFKENNGKSHYFHRFNKEGTDWKQISRSEIIELGLLSTEFLNMMRTQVENQELGKRLDRVLSYPDNCKKLLQHISYSIYSIIVLMDYKKQYGLSEIIELTKEGKDIQPIVMSYTVEVKEDKTYKTCKKIGQYQIFKHDLNNAIKKAVQKANNNQFYIRLYSDSKNVILDDRDEKSPPTCLTYDKTCNDLFVYFKKDGTKPLLLYYNKMAYGLNDAKDNRWYRIKKVTNCTAIDQIRPELNRISGFVTEPKSKLKPAVSQGAGLSESQRNGASGRFSSKEAQATSQKSASNVSPHNVTHSDKSVIDGKQNQGHRAAGNAKPNSSTSTGASHGRPGNRGTKHVLQSPQTGKTRHPDRALRSDSNSNDISGQPIPSEQNRNTEYQTSESPISENDSNKTLINGAAGGAGGTVGAIGAGVGGYFIYDKLIRPR